MRIKLAVLVLLAVGLPGTTPMPAEAMPCCISTQTTAYTTHYSDYCADDWSNCVSEVIEIDCFC